MIGRTKDVGAPLGLARVRPRELPATSHVRLAHPSLHGGARLLRRGYNFVDGSDGLGHLDGGLFFLAYQRDPRRGFVPIQTELARHDATALADTIRAMPGPAEVVTVLERLVDDRR